MAYSVRAQRLPIRQNRDSPDSEFKARFIISTNIHRRHLTESQRADISAALANLEHGDNQHGRTGKSAAPITQAQAAEMMGVSERLVRDAKMVQEKAPDLAAKVKSGELKVSKAASMARERVKATDPDRADDRVVDATAEAHADGWRFSGTASHGASHRHFRASMSPAKWCPKTNKPRLLPGFFVWYS